MIRFGSEWILVEDPETVEALQVLRGKVMADSKDRDEVYRRAAEARPKRFAILNTRPLPSFVCFNNLRYACYAK